MSGSYQFQQKVNNALAVVKRVLDNTRDPAFVGEVPHNYDDKYAVVEQMGASALRCSGTALGHLGVTPEIWDRMQEWAAKRTVTLRFGTEAKCKFSREIKRIEKSSTAHVSQSMFGKSESYSETTIIDYEWTVSVHYTLRAFSGSDPNGKDSVELLTNTGEITFVTRSKNMPREESKVSTPYDVEIAYLVKSIGPNLNGQVPFKIARESKEHCKTPRRNAQVDAALEFLHSLSNWACQINYHFQGLVHDVNNTGGGAGSNEVDVQVDLGSLFDSTEIFVPVLPLMDKNRARGGSANKVPALTAADGLMDESSDSTTLVESTDGPTLSGGITTNKLHGEHESSITARFEKASKLFAGSSKQKQTVITVAEANVIIVLAHVQQICGMFQGGVNSIEDELRRQVVDAIGKIVTTKDMSEYMVFHSRKIYTPDTMPKPFCYDVRRAGFAPEGEVSLQTSTDNDAVWTSCHVNNNAPTFNFALSAATDVKVEGRHVLHGYMSHKYSTQSSPPLQLVARARQFSHFIVMVGRIVAADRFEPKHAIIVQNKDLVKIPLDTEVMPTAKEFAEAVESLSPEQKEFATAFRGMQLESTLFGVLVIPVKPLLERLLKLPEGALAKEIRLTEDLMELFIEYQVPSDMVTFSGADDANKDTRIEAVRGYVKALMDMIKETKEEEVKQAKQERDYDGVEFQAAAAPHPMMAMMARGGMGGGGMDMRMRSAAPQQQHHQQQLRPQQQQQQQQQQQAPMSPGMSFGSMSAPPAAAAAAASVPSYDQFMEDTTFEAQSFVQTTEDKADVQGEQGEIEQAPVSTSAGVDYTAVPRKLDSVFGLIDPEAKLRPTKLIPSNRWTRERAKNLLDKSTTDTITTDSLTSERSRAMDLMDALSRSGELPLVGSTLHVVVAVTHCFDKSVMDTLVQDNVNPIVHMERSSLMLSGVIHDKPMSKLINEQVVKRVKVASPMLFLKN